MKTVERDIRINARAAMKAKAVLKSMYCDMAPTAGKKATIMMLKNID